MSPRILLRRARAVMVTALLLTPAALRAQSAEGGDMAPNLAPGDRLRVDVRGSRAPSRVRLVRATSDTLWVRAWSVDPAGSGETFAVPLASMRRLQRSQGRHTHVRRNGGYGLAGGVLVGAVVGAMAGAADDGDDYFDISPAVGALVLGVVLGVPAGVVGALTGLAPTEEWTDVAVLAGPRVPSPSARDGLAVRPRLGLTRVPMRGAPAARAFTLGLTVRPR